MAQEAPAVPDTRRVKAGRPARSNACSLRAPIPVTGAGPHKQDGEHLTVVQ